MKKLLTFLCTFATIILMTGCEVTVKNEDDEYKEKYETLVSEVQSAQQEYADQTIVAATAKEIYTALASYMTSLGIKNEPVPDNFTYSNYKETLYNEGYLSQDLYLNNDLIVEWIYDADTYSARTVTVTIQDITVTYPEQ